MEPLTGLVIIEFPSPFFLVTVAADLLELGPPGACLHPEV